MNRKTAGVDPITLSVMWSGLVSIAELLKVRPRRPRARRTFRSSASLSNVR